jgi:chromodomain-helicase-DNA-binding protein 7
LKYNRGLFLLGQSSRGSKKYRKLKQKDFNSTQLIDEEHWSRNNKYDGDLFLESNYRKHLSRHANKFVNLVFMFV